MANLFESEDIKDFFVWIDPNNFLANWNFNKVGSLFSMPVKDDADNLMFIPNPDFSGFVSPFQGNLLWNYKAEYNLELSRKTYFNRYPSRLTSIFLFETELEANKYQEYVKGREIKHVKTVGKYKFSKHDLSWIDFLRLFSGNDRDTINSVGNAYWQGEKVENCVLLNCGKPWTKQPIFEVLYQGTVVLVK